MEVAVLIQEDRHFDTEVEVYTNHERALQAAHALAKALARDSGLVEHPLTEEMICDRWIYWATYTVEDDSIRVVLRTVSEEEPGR